MLEGESVLGEFEGDGVYGGEEEFLAHFAEDEFYEGTWHGE